MFSCLSLLRSGCRRISVKAARSLGVRSKLDMSRTSQLLTLGSSAAATGSSSLSPSQPPSPYCHIYCPLLSSKYEEQVRELGDFPYSVKLRRSFFGVPNMTGVNAFWKHLRLLGCVQNTAYCKADRHGVKIILYSTSLKPEQKMPRLRWRIRCVPTSRRKRFLETPAPP